MREGKKMTIEEARMYDPADLDGIKINRLRPRHIFYLEKRQIRKGQTR